jgi:hypothetical protein
MFLGWMLDGWLTHPVGGSLLTVAEAVHQSGTAKARGASAKIAEMMINFDQPRDDRAWHIMAAHLHVPFNQSGLEAP